MKRVENHNEPKRPQRGVAVWVRFGFQLGLRQSEALVIIYTMHFLVNRVENQNEPRRPQSGGRLGSFWCSTRPFADTGTYYHGVDYDRYPCLA